MWVRDGTSHWTPQSLRSAMVDAMQSNKELMQANAKNYIEWKRETEKLLEPGKYEVSAGDYLVPALVTCTRENALVLDIKRGKVFAFAASIWKGEAVNQPPLLLVYDGSHFETLLAKSEEDAQLTKDYFDQQVKNDEIERVQIKLDKLERRIDKLGEEATGEFTRVIDMKTVKMKLIACEKEFDLVKKVNTQQQQRKSIIHKLGYFLDVIGDKIGEAEANQATATTVPEKVAAATATAENMSAGAEQEAQVISLITPHLTRY